MTRLRTLLVLTIVMIAALSAAFVYLKQNTNVPAEKTEITNKAAGYSFDIPSGWKAQLSDKTINGQVEGQYGDLVPSQQNSAGQILFQSGKNSGLFSFESYKQASPELVEIKAKNITGLLKFVTDADPRINTLEVSFITPKNIYRFAYEVNKDYSKPDSIPYYAEFMKIVESFESLN